MSQLMLCTSTRIHPKIRRLKKELGPKGVLALYNLWCFCKEYRQDGHLTDMGGCDISEAADYDGDPTKFIEALVRLRLLDKNGEVLSVHGWAKYNAGKPKRRSVSASTGNNSACETTATGVNSLVLEVVSYYRSIHPRRGKNIKQGSLDWKRIQTKIENGYSIEDLKKAIDGNKICKWHQNVPAGHSIEFIFRNATKIEGFVERANAPEQYASTEIGHHKGSEDFKDGDQAVRF